MPFYSFLILFLINILCFSNGSPADVPTCSPQLSHFPRGFTSSSSSRKSSGHVCTQAGLYYGHSSHHHCPNFCHLPHTKSAPQHLWDMDGDVFFLMVYFNSLHFRSLSMKKIVNSPSFLTFSPTSVIFWLLPTLLLTLLFMCWRYYVNLNSTLKGCRQNMWKNANQCWNVHWKV